MPEETTIWSKIEVERARRDKIRERLEATNVKQGNAGTIYFDHNTLATTSSSMSTEMEPSPYITTKSRSDSASMEAPSVCSSSSSSSPESTSSYEEDIQIGQRDIVTSQAPQAPSEDTRSESGDNVQSASEYWASRTTNSPSDAFEAAESGRMSSQSSVQSNSNRTSRRTWGEKRKIKAEDKAPTEWWVYFVAMFVCVFTTAGLTVIVLLVFGALDNRDPVKNLQNELAYLSPDSSVFDDPESPQNLAIDWLVNTDEFSVDLDKTQRVSIRYSLAVLYFATGGNSKWKNSLNFLSDSHECDWNIPATETDDLSGVECDSDRKVVRVAVRNNKLIGSLPDELIALTSLRKLDLSQNKMTGTLPSFWTFDDLEWLSVKNNYIDGPLMFTYEGFVQLTHLDVSENSLSSSLPSELGLLTSLEFLSAGSNKHLNGTIPFQWGSLTSLKHLNISDNTFDGFMGFIERFPKVETLDVSSNGFFGSVPESVWKLSNLEEINFSANKLEGTLPLTTAQAERGSSPYLGRIKAFHGGLNSIRGEFPWNNLGDSLIQISMPGNMISGSLPQDLGRFTRLTTIDFQRNQLGGSLPRVFGLLSELRISSFAQNSLTGQIPSTIRMLTSLEVFDISANEISGTVPASLGDLDSLTILNLSTNELVGEVPSELGQLQLIGKNGMYLNVLYLNSLDKPLTMFLFVSEENLGLHTNQLTGDINFLCDIPSLPVISADCGGSSPEIDCTCCSICL